LAHIFKNPTSDVKGIIVFTHKEMDWFFPVNNKILVKKFAKPGGFKRTEIIKNFLLRPYSKAFHKIHPTFLRTFFLVHTQPKDQLKIISLVLQFLGFH